MKIAEKIEGLSIALDLDSLALERGLTGVKDRLRTVNSEMRRNMSAFDYSDRSVQKYETRLEGLNKKLQVQERVTEESRKEYEKMVDEYGKGSAEAEEAERAYNNQSASLNNLQRYVDRTTEELEELRKEQELQDSTWGRFSTNLDAFAGKMSSAGEALTGFGKKMSTRVTLPLVGMGTAALTTGMNFEEGMSKVQAISGATGDELVQLEDMAKDLGETTRFSATEAASGMEFLAMSGMNTNEVLETMPGLLDLAASSGMDLGRAADIATNILSGFGMEAEEAGRVSDVLAKGASTANTTVEQLGGAMAVVAPVANALELEIEGVSAAVGFMSDAGLQGEQAGRMLRQGFLRLSNPTGKAADLIEDLGINVFDADGNMKDLDDVVRELEKGLDGMSSEAQTAALSTLFGAESVAGWTALIERGSDELSDYTDELIDSEGAASEMSDTMQDNAKGAITEFRSALEGVGIAVAEHLLPAFTTIVEKGTNVVRKFGELDDSTQKTILIVGGLAAAIGPLAVGFGGLLTAIAPVLTAIAGAGGFAAALGLLANPIGLTIGALATLGAGFALLDKEMDKPVIKSDIFAGEISDATEQAVGSYMALDEDATAELNSLAWSQDEITSEMKDNMIATYDEMYNTVLQAMRENHEEQLEEQQRLFDETAVLEEEEAARRIAKLKADQLAEEKALTEGQERIREIWQTASDERRGITDAEAQEIDQIQEDRKIEAVKQLSESQQEQKTILNNIKNQSEVIEAETAANTVAKSVETRDKVVDEANKRYNETVSAAESGRDELGIITADEADQMIAEAERARNETVAEAEDRHYEIIKNAQDQAGKHVSEVNWETGSVMSAWDKMWNGIADVWNPIADMFGAKTMKKRGVYQPSKRQQIQGQTISAYADGTLHGTHEGGLALVGEEGYEMGYIPNAGYTILGTDGPEITDLPKGTAVLPHKETKSLLKKYNLPAYKDGTDDTSMFSWLFDGAKTLWNNMLDKVSFFDNFSMPDWFIPIKDIMGVISDGFVSKIDDLKDDFFGSLTNIGGSGVQRWAGVATTALRMTNQYTAANLDRLLYQMQTESGGNPQAINLWDINAKRGTPSKGLMQVIDPTFAAYKMPGFNNIWNPLDNMLASIRYAVSRYGSLARAYRGVGYATGGLIEDEGLYKLAEEGWPEFVIPTAPNRRTEAMKLLALAGRKLTGDGNNKRPNQLPNVNTSNENSYFKQIIGNLSEQVQDTKEIVELLTKLLLKDNNVYLDSRQLSDGLYPHLQRKAEREEISRARAQGRQI